MRGVAIALVMAVSAWAAEPGPAPRMLDSHGDPMPAGAVQRLGLARFRAPEADCIFSADSSRIITLTRGGRVAVLETATGRVVESFAIPTTDIVWGELIPGGRRALIRRETTDKKLWEFEVWDLFPPRRHCRIEFDRTKYEYNSHISPRGTPLLGGALTRAAARKRR